MSDTIKIISTQKIEVIRELAYIDRSPDLTKAGAIVGSDSLMRVNTLKPVSYHFQVGSNEVPEPFTFTDPVTRQQVSESLLTWPTVKHLIEAGVFEVFKTADRVDFNDLKNTKKAKSLDTIAESTK
jgi:hypothetical protein